MSKEVKPLPPDSLNFLKILLIVPRKKRLLVIELFDKGSIPTGLMAVNVGLVDYFNEFEKFFPPKGKKKCGMVERPRVSGSDNYFEIWTDILVL